jgi:fumarylacetoacetate (FAA) hydrolase
VRLCRFRAAGRAPRPGRVEGQEVVALEAGDLIDVLDAGFEVDELERFALDDVELCAPLEDPPSIRDFLTFEEHIRNARAARGEPVPPEWYELMPFYFSNPAAIYGPDHDVPRPPNTSQLDYELEVAGVIGRDGAIAGFTIMNDWSARDIQRVEMRVGLGPAKGKDFATSLGPVLVTSDEFDGNRGVMVARVNGEERSRGELSAMYRSWDDIVGAAAQNTRLRSGDIIGSGTVGNGCILEHGDGRWLRPGDRVELEIEGLGVLANTIV